MLEATDPRVLMTGAAQEHDVVFRFMKDHYLIITATSPQCQNISVVTCVYMIKHNILLLDMFVMFQVFQGESASLLWEALWLLC